MLPKFPTKAIQQKYFQRLKKLQIKSLLNYVILGILTTFIRTVFYFLNSLESSKNILGLTMGIWCFALTLSGIFLYKIREINKWMPLLKILLYGNTFTTIIFLIVFFSFIEDDFSRGFSFIIVIMLMQYICISIYRNFAASVYLYGVMFVMYFLSFKQKGFAQFRESFVKLFLCSSVCLFLVFEFEKQQRVHFILTQQKKERNKLYLEFLEKLRDPIIFYSESKGVIFSNKEAIKYFGEYQRNTSIQNYLPLISEEGNSLSSYIKDILSKFKENQNQITGKNFSCAQPSIGIPKKNEKKTFFSISLVLGSYLFEDKEVVGILIKDISSQLDMIQQQISSKYNILIQTSFSHQIKNSLNGVVGILNILEMETFNLATRQLIHQALATSSVIDFIMNDIIDFSHMLEGNLELRPCVFQIKDLFHNLLNIIEKSYKNESVALSSKIDKELPTSIYGDKDRIGQVLMTLLQTSSTNTDSGEIILKASKETNDSKPFIKFSIHDTGIPFNMQRPSELINLIQPQSSTSDLKDELLTKCGLSTASLICKELGGEMEITSPKRTQGNTYSFKIPLVPKIEEEDDCIYLETVPGENISDLSLRKSFIPQSMEDAKSMNQNINSKFRIFIIDRDKCERSRIKNLIFSHSKLKNVIVHEGSTGNEALLLLSSLGNSSVPILIFLDNGIRDNNPLKIVSKIKASKNSAKKFCIIMEEVLRIRTAKKSDKAKLVDLFAIKPISQEIILEVVVQIERKEPF